MTERHVSSDDEATAIYEIRLQGAAPGPLRREFPSATVITRRTETVLFQRVDEPAELDALLQQLLSMGMVLTEVHEVEQSDSSGEEPPENTSGKEQSDGDL